MQAISPGLTLARIHARTTNRRICPVVSCRGTFRNILLSLRNSDHSQGLRLEIVEWGREAVSREQRMLALQGSMEYENRPAYVLIMARR